MNNMFRLAVTDAGGSEGIMLAIARTFGVTALLTSLAFAAPASAAVIYVSTMGDDATGVGSPTNPYRSLQAAVGAAVDGDTISCDGPFSQADQVAIIGKSVTILCPNGVISPNDLPALLFNGGGKDTVNVNGLGIVVGPGAGGGPVVRFDRGHKLTLNGVNLTGSGKGIGVLDRTSSSNSELIVRNSTIGGFDQGLFLEPRSTPGTHHINLDNITVHNNDSGIQLNGGTVFLQNSNISSNTVGVNNAGGGNLVLRNDIFFANQTGLQSPFTFTGGNNGFFNRGQDFDNDNFTDITIR
jgi:hypothetical protein